MESLHHYAIPINSLIFLHLLKRNTKKYIPICMKVGLIIWKLIESSYPYCGPGCKNAVLVMSIYYESFLNAIVRTVQSRTRVDHMYKSLWASLFHRKLSTNPIFIASSQKIWYQNIFSFWWEYSFAQYIFLCFH